MRYENNILLYNKNKEREGRRKEEGGGVIQIINIYYNNTGVGRYGNPIFFILPELFLSELISSKTYYDIFCIEDICTCI